MYIAALEYLTRVLEQSTCHTLTEKRQRNAEKLRPWVERFIIPATQIRIPVLTYKFTFIDGVVEL